MECKKVFVRRNKDGKYGFYYCKVNKFIEGYSFDTVKKANETLNSLSDQELLKLIDKTRRENMPVDCEERITFKPYKINDNSYGVRSCDNVTLPLTKTSKEEINKLLADEKSLKQVKEEYKKKITKKENANSELKKNISVKIIALALVFSLGVGIASILTKKHKLPHQEPINPTTSTTEYKDEYQEILKKHQELANKLTGPNLSTKELEKLVMYINISDYANTDNNISVEDLYSNFTNCIGKILDYDLQNTNKLKLNTVINDKTQRENLKVIEDYRDKIYSTTNEDEIISYYNKLINYLDNNNMNEITYSASIIAINEICIYANNFYNDRIFSLRNQLLEYTVINEQDIINNGYDILSNKSLSSMDYARTLVKNI